ncbi:hypothetical protein [Arenimonas alkanexedens]
MSAVAVWLALAIAPHTPMPTPLDTPALPFECAQLQAVVAEAPTRFNKIRGSWQVQETAVALAARLGVPFAEVDPDYVHTVNSSDTPLRGAKLCEVVDVWHGDEDARISQIAHVCSFPEVESLSPAFNAQLAQCLDRAPDPDADASSVDIEIDLVASGEGYGHTTVSASADPVSGLRLSVMQTICEVRQAGGCDEE